MYKANQERSKIIAEHFYPWKALLAISLLFTVLSFVPIVPIFLQAIFQLLGVGAIFLAGGRWIFDRSVYWFNTDGIPSHLWDALEAEMENRKEGIDGRGRKEVRKLMDADRDPID